MIEIPYEEKDKVNNLYNKIKKIILSKKDNKSFEYNYKQHHLYEESEYPGISENYYNESGAVEFKNINDKIIRLEINRCHKRCHNGYSGLDNVPTLKAEICIIEFGEKQVLWKLNVESRTLYYKAEVSDLEIPNDILQEKQLQSDCHIQESTNKQPKEELNIFNSLFEKYTTFNIDLIGNAIKQIMSIVENEEYLYKQITYNLTNSQTKIIVKKDIFQKYYRNYNLSASIINKLVETGNAILLSDQEINNQNNKITFYVAQKNQIVCKVNFCKFTYIKELIDSIIQHRIENNIVEFSEKDMLLFLKNFIVEYKDTIVENYSAKIKEKALYLRLDD